MTTQLNCIEERVIAVSRRLNLRQIEAAKASKESGRPAIHVIRCEVEALRIDIMQGRAAQALPQAWS
jgi:hypothetical protein